MHPEVWLTNPLSDSQANQVDTVKLSHYKRIHSTFPPAVTEGKILPHPGLGVEVLFNCSHSSHYVVICHCDINLYIPITSNTE